MYTNYLFIYRTGEFIDPGTPLRVLCVCTYTHLHLVITWGYTTIKFFFLPSSRPARSQTGRVIDRFQCSVFAPTESPQAARGLESSDYFVCYTHYLCPHVRPTHWTVFRSNHRHLTHTSRPFETRAKELICSTSRLYIL